MMILANIKFWLNNARYHALGQSFWAALAAVCIAYNYDTFNLMYSVMAVLGVLFAHLSINLLDDFFDYISGSVNKRNEQSNSVRKGKCLYLIEETATPKQLFCVASIFGFMAILIGGYLFLHRGYPILILTLFAVILGFFYSAPPFKFCYNGLGEIIVGIMFGPMMMNGVFYCATGTISLQLLLVSLAVGVLVANILYVHSLMDMDADLMVGKNSLAVVLKNTGLRIFVLLFFTLYPYWIAIVGVKRYAMPVLCLATLLTLPHALVLIKFMVERLIKYEKFHSPRFWMGPMEQWDRIKKIGIDWFMIRWYLARNIAIFYCFIVCLAYFLKKII